MTLPVHFANNADWKCPPLSGALRAFVGLFLCLILLSAGFCGTAAASDVDGVLEHTHSADYASSMSEGYCSLCDLAVKVNALPAASEISEDNAFAVELQLIAIDQLKYKVFSINDEEYYEAWLSLLNEIQSNPSGNGYPIPSQYVNASEKVLEVQGSLVKVVAVKKYMPVDGQAVNAADAQVVFSLTKEGGSPQQFTLSTVNPDFPYSYANNNIYSEVLDGSTLTGWQYTLYLPAGTYTIEEISDSGAVLSDGTLFVTGSTTVQVGNDAAVSGKSAEFTVGDGESVSILFMNTLPKYKYTITAKGSNGSDLDEGFSFTLKGKNPESTVNSPYELTSTKEYILTINSVPDGYIMPTQREFTFMAGISNPSMSGIFTHSESNGQYSITVTLTKKTDVTFYNGNEQHLVANITYQGTEFNKTITVPTTRTGYTFLGWNTTVNGGVMVVNETGFLLKSVPAYTNDNGEWTNSSSTVSLFAAWKLNTYTVTFDENGGSGTMADQTFTHGVSQELSANAFTHPGDYTFKGWNTAADGSGISYTDKAYVSITESTTLYAQWAGNPNEGIPEGEPQSRPSSGTNVGTHDTYPRTTENGGEVGFGTSPVVIKVILPDGTTGTVTLITNPETPKTGDADVYYDFALDIPNYPENEDGKVIWRIPTSLLDEEFGADDYGVRIFEDGEWKPLDSVWEENGTYHIYTTGISSDGNFIIVKEKGAAEKRTDETPVVKPEEPPKEEPSAPGEILPPISGDSKPDDKEEEEPKVPVLGIGIGLLILILVIIGIVFTVSRRK